MSLSKQHPRKDRIKPVQLSESLYECPLCDNAVGSQEEIDNHVLNVHNVSIEGPQQCLYCSENFPNRMQRRTHMGREHGVVADTPLNCPKCLSPCTGAAFLITHSEVHRAQTARDHRYFCMMCPVTKIETFHSSAYLKLHMASKHFLNKPVCMECGFAFPFEEQLLEHYEIQHKSDNSSSFGTKDARCPTCRRIFQFQFQLDAHSVVCEIVECEYCYCLQSIHNPEHHVCGAATFADETDLHARPRSVVVHRRYPNTSSIERTNLARSANNRPPKKLAKKARLIEDTNSESSKNEDEGSLSPSPEILC